MVSKDELFDMAIVAKENAYAPYSQFRVGAALLGKSGRVFYGVNVENASYGLSICAERSAVCAAVTAGERQFELLALAGDDNAQIVPCGACLQVLAEFSPQLLLLLPDTHHTYKEINLQQLLSTPFCLNKNLKGENV